MQTDSLPRYTPQTERPPRYTSQVSVLSPGASKQLKILDKNYQQHTLVRIPIGSEPEPTRPMSIYGRWKRDDDYYADKSTTSAIPERKRIEERAGSMWDRWSADDEWYNKDNPDFTPRTERENYAHAIQTESFGKHTYPEKRFWTVFRVHVYPELLSQWHSVIAQEDKPHTPQAFLSPDVYSDQAKTKTNFDSSISFLEPVLPRLGLSLTETGLLQHLHLNLSRAGYYHLSHDKDSSYVDPVYGDLIRGYSDPSYILSRRAKNFYSGTPTEKIPGFDTLNKSSVLYKTLAPRKLYNSLDTACPMCHKGFARHSRVVLLPCTHLIHKDCAADWFVMVRDSCPVCEYNYRHLEYPNHSCEIKDWRI